MNRGDSCQVFLSYTVDGVPLADAELTDIEFMFGTSRFLLSEGTIVLDSETNQYTVTLTQDDTFKCNGWTSYQIRVKKGENVSSWCINSIYIGETISNEVI